MPTPPQSILFSAGDVSGDVHSAALARTLLERDPGRTLHALGGARLRAVVARSPGGRFLGDTTHTSAIGIPSAVKVYFRCRGLYGRLREFLRSHRVDAAVLCDWGAFNGRILPQLHALGIPVFYYFPPRSWQRTGSHGLGIAPFVTRVATPFEWSAQRLRAAGCDAEWVGHPALENAPPAAEKTAFRARFGVEKNETLIALLPGSRQSEIRLLSGKMADAAELVRKDFPARFIAVAPEEVAADARSHLPASIEVATDCAGELLLAADAAIVKTGTASLEAVLAGTPHVAVYDVAWATRLEWCLLWAWQRIPYLAMPNIILQREAVPELIGPKCTAQKIAAALRTLLTDEAVRRRMRADYAEIRRALGSELPILPTQRTAQMVEEMMADAAAPAGLRE